jgi:DNA mismatch endonuclease, patch repair protein
MKSNRGRNTQIEVLLRSELFRRRLRFFKHRRPISRLRCEPDVVFPKARLAVFIDGCFWHGCPIHATRPVVNGEWWSQKLDGNVTRDRKNDTALMKAGWTVLRYWEHQDLRLVADEIQRTLLMLRLGSSL